MKKKKQLTQSQAALLQMLQSNPDHWIQFYAKKDVNNDLKVYNIDKISKYFISYEERTGKLMLFTKYEGSTYHVDISLKQIDAWFAPAELVMKIVKLKQKVETFGQHEDRVKKEKVDALPLMAPPPERAKSKEVEEILEQGPFSKGQEDKDE